MRILLIVILSFTMFGCATKCVPKIEIKYVDVPVYIQPDPPPVVNKPALPVDQLENSDTNESIAKAYVSSVELLKIYSRQLEEALRPYRNDSNRND